ncbi:helix-turn-helix transcriptional regulator [Actinokineospora iranica]|nr:AlpA family phage regulatory protein [Actinokineospora iranica]
MKPTLSDIQRWPATVDVPTAATAFGISTSHAYELINRHQFPARTIQLGARRVVITASIIEVLSGQA